MNEQSFTTTITVDQTPMEVFDAINKVSSWWQGQIEGSANETGSEFIYRMKDIHYSKQKVLELVPAQKIVWLVTDSLLNFVDNKTEWTGTKIIFEIAASHNQTQVQFTHQGLVPGFECYGGCSRGWSGLIQQSLYNLITTGKGKDVF
jgi:hypothetical protein